MAAERRDRRTAASAAAARSWSLSYAEAQLQEEGLAIRGSAEAAHTTTFSDAGALAWFLKAIPRVVEGFSVETHRSHLERLHERIQEQGPITIREPAFWLEAMKPLARTL